jgi:hypothetical protein
VVEGVPARRRRFAGGASGIDCSTLVPSSMSMSPRSEEGKSRAGGDDIVNGVVQHRRRGEQDVTRRVHFEFRAGSITLPTRYLALTFRMVWLLGSRHPDDTALVLSTVTQQSL